ncbi:MAG: aldolase/citrate lyase family protein [Desulfovibrionaceae bacterium]|nr:aldolase/citrate lyase family protein [Desulfovibrionaceae bacterium]
MKWKTRALLKSGRAVVGTWLQFPSADVAEAIAGAGYDYVAVDLEHGAFTRAQLPDIFRAIECGGSAPFARIAEAEQRPIKAALDSGAQGLIFPMIETREQLDRAISWSLYPDGGGTRGVGFSRANDYGEYFDAYRTALPDQLTLVAQIEHIRAVDNLSDIVSHPRLDAIMVGPYDLSGSMGLTGQFDHPDFVAAMQRISDICRRHGMVMGQHVVEPNPEKLGQCIRNGYRFLAYGIDTVFLLRASKCPPIPR